MAQTTQDSSLIETALRDDLRAGEMVRFSYPAGSGPDDFRVGGGRLLLPDLSLSLVESVETFSLAFGSVITLTYHGENSLPAGARVVLYPRQNVGDAPALSGEQPIGFSLPAGGGVARRFGVQARTRPDGFPKVYLSPYRPAAAVPYAVQAGMQLPPGADPSSLPPSGFINWSEREGNAGGQALIPTDPAWFLAGPEAARAQETADARPGGIQGLAALGVGSAGAIRAAGIERELEQLSRYDAGRIQAEISELQARFPGHPGMDNARPPVETMPLIVIRNEEGRILLQGRAESEEHLISLKLQEAARSTDPTKQTVDLSGAQLDERTLGRKLDFRGFNFQNVDLRGANLGGAQFRDCQFRNVDMEGVSLKGATFNLCHFENVNMAGFVGDHKTRIANSSMYNVDMSYAEAPQIRLENIRGEFINMQGANFSGARIQGLHVENLWAKDVVLDGAKIGDMRVSGPHSSLEGAHLNGAEIGRSVFGTREHPLNMQGVQAQGSRWNEVVLVADLSNADFSRANLTKVDMRHSTTPRGPMNINDATLEGVKAGQNVKLRATSLTVGEGSNKVRMTMEHGAEAVFNGTDELDKAWHKARLAGLSYIHLRQQGAGFEVIDPETGRPLTPEEQEAERVKVEKKRQAKLSNDMMPRPKNPWDRRG